MLAKVKIMAFNVASSGMWNRSVCVAGRRKMHYMTRARIADNFDNTLGHRKHWFLSIWLE